MLKLTVCGCVCVCVCVCVCGRSRCRGDGGRGALRCRPAATLLPGESLRAQEQQPHHGRGSRLHRHGNGRLCSRFWVPTSVDLYTGVLYASGEDCFCLPWAFIHL